MRKRHNFLKLIAVSNQYSPQIYGKMNNNKVSIILTIVTLILSCYALLQICFLSYDILKFQLSVSILIN